MNERDVIINYLLLATLYCVVDKNGVPREILYESREEAEEHCPPTYSIKEFKHISPILNTCDDTIAIK
jgi:hypothetical protein